MDSLNKVTVKIFDSDYKIVGSEPTSYIKELALEVDKQMRAVYNNMHLTPVQTAVLTALNICDGLYKERKKNQPNESLKNELNKMTAIKTQYNALLEENKYLKAELRSMRANSVQKDK